MTDPAWRVILNAVSDVCETELLATQSEHYLKVVTIGRLLRAGGSIIEPGNRPGKGRLLRYDGKRVTAALIDLPLMPAPADSEKRRLSPDIRVYEPERVTVELQARSQFGSQSTLFTKNIADDLRRLATRQVDLFVLAADCGIYDSLRGLKQDRRGRRALLPPGVWAQILPASSVLSAQAPDVPFTSPDGLVQVYGTRRDSPAGVQRVVVAVQRAEAQTSQDQA